MLHKMSEFMIAHVPALCLLVGLSAATYRVLASAKNGKQVSSAQNLASLRGFELQEVLKDEDDGRVVTLLGRFLWQKDGEMALVKLIASPLPLGALLNNLKRLHLECKTESGAEYAFYDCTLSAWKSFLHRVKGLSYSMEVVAPASERTVNRHRSVPTAMWTETPSMYHAITEAHVTDDKALSWLYNVLVKEKEADRILYEDDDKEQGFILNIDTKWRTHPDVTTVPREGWYGHPSVTDLYCLAVCHKKGIRTLRDLRAIHLPMLRNMYNRGVETIREVYGVPENQLRVFVHYLPQFFHFHVHFSRVHNTIGADVERAHLLLGIIQNLEADSNFYTSRTLQFRLRENDPLHRALLDAETSQS